MNEKELMLRGKRIPIGLVPKYVRRNERFVEVCEAIVRYYDAELKIPLEWVEEYNELISERENR